MRRSRLKIFLLYFAPQFSVYTKFGIDPVFQRVQIMIVLINKSILQIKLATQEKMICLEKSKR